LEKKVKQKYKPVTTRGKYSIVALIETYDTLKHNVPLSPNPPPDPVTPPTSTPFVPHDRMILITCSHFLFSLFSFFVADYAILLLLVFVDLWRREFAAV
jgi:hypothetical protein